MIEVHTWQIITFFITIALTLAGLFIGVFKWSATQFSAKLDERFKALDESLTKTKGAAREAQKQVQALEKEVLMSYQRREDAIRSETSHTARYDAINAKIDNVIQQLIKNDVKL